MVSSFSIILLKIKQKPKIHVFAVITFLDTPSSSPVFSLLSVYQIREEKANFVFFKSVSSICRIFQKNILFAKEWPKSIEK